MSGAEIIGLIADIISIIDASVKIYNAAGEASGLPSSFRDVASRLPLIQESLRLASDGIQQSSETPECCSALGAVLVKCSERATALYEIIQAVVTSAEASRAERYRKALKTVRRAGRVDALVEGIVGDLQVLTYNHAVKAVIRGKSEG